MGGGAHPRTCGAALRHQSIGSMRGVPGHAHNPAVALCHADTNETTGDAWGFAFVYSGNYLIEAERCDAGERLVMGIHPYHFHWTLAPVRASPPRKLPWSTPIKVWVR